VDPAALQRLKVGTVRLGGVLSTLATLGPSPRSDWSGSPADGNDFETRYAEDFALFAEIGITTVRLGLDWSRLEPVPGGIDDDWREWYTRVFDAAALHGVDVWASLHELTVPQWFDDEGGAFADERAAGRWWPRWVERCAELFGDRVAGWFPINDPVTVAAAQSHDPARYERTLVNLATAWRDAWRVLRGGPPVATSLGVVLPRATDQSVPAQQAARATDRLVWRLWLGALRDGTVQLPSGDARSVADLGASLDVLGIATTLDHPEAELTDESIRRWQERLGSILRRAGEEGPDRPITVSGLSIGWNERAERHLLVEAAVRAIEDAVADGVRVESVYVDPAIGDGGWAALVDRDRERATPPWWDV